MLSFPKLKQATDSLEVQAENERGEMLVFGRRSITIFNDSLQVTLNNEGRSSRHWLLALSRVDRNTTFSSAKDIARNQARSIENHIDKINGKLVRRDRHSIEWHRKFILAISCIVLFFVGAPLGALLKEVE